MSFPNLLAECPRARPGTADLANEKPFGPAALIFDWKVSAKAECGVSVGGLPVTVALSAGAKRGNWERAGIRAKKGSHPASIIFNLTESLEMMNVFVRELTEK